MLNGIKIGLQRPVGALVSRMSAELAPEFLVFPRFTDANDLIRLFTDGWKLDYRSPIVRDMADVCSERLLGS